MNTSQDRHSGMRTKLQEGLQLLAEAAPRDKHKLGMALIKLHGALEDHVRLEVARKSPTLSEVVEDPKKTNWRDLIIYGKQYLGFTESDGRMITDANYQRQEVAHGGNYGKTRADLVKYARFVHSRCAPNEQLMDLTYRKPTVESSEDTQPTSPLPARSQPIPPPRETYQPPRVEQRSYSPVYRRPWYRSTLFLVLTFFLLPPLWAFLIVTDRRHGCLLKLIAYTILITTVILVYSFYTYFDRNWETLWSAFDEIEVPILPTLLPPLDGSPAPDTGESPPVVNTPGSGAAGQCVVVWVEYEADDLGGMNRSMVWEEIVFERIKESGMTAREFYDQVVKNNPDLVADGYEFKKGKTYLLPECK